MKLCLFLSFFCLFIYLLFNTQLIQWSVIIKEFKVIIICLACYYFDSLPWVPLHPSPAAYEDAIEDKDSCNITFPSKKFTFVGYYDAMFYRNSMEVKNLVQKENEIQMNISITNYNSPYEIKTSPDFVINKSALIQMKIVVLQEQSEHINLYNNLLLIRFVDIIENTSIITRLEIKSIELEIDKTITADDEGTWHLLKELKSQQYNFDFNAKMETTMSYGPFASLHNDTVFTDFELRCEDGYVTVHSAVLAAHSPVFKRMLSGFWKETKDRYVELPRTSRFTLQHLKDFLYLETLPDEGVEQLLMLSSCYMMSVLEQRCKAKLVSLNATIDYGLIKFATKCSYKTNGLRLRY